LAANHSITAVRRRLMVLFGLSMGKLPVYSRANTVRPPPTEREKTS